jgi:hypothetical protein
MLRFETRTQTCDLGSRSGYSVQERLNVRLKPFVRLYKRTLRRQDGLTDKLVFATPKGGKRGQCVRNLHRHRKVLARRPLVVRRQEVRVVNRTQLEAARRVSEVDRARVGHRQSVRQAREKLRSLPHDVGNRAIGLRRHGREILLVATPSPLHLAPVRAAAGLSRCRQSRY